MTKRIQAKHKVDRRLGVNLWGRPKSPFNKRAFGPGQHGQTKAKGKPSDYKIQLQAKQKLKSYYGNLNERQFRNVFKEANRVRGNTGENLVGILESRLDSVVYRAKFAQTVFQARQIINHGHVKVNGKKVNIYVKSGATANSVKELLMFIESPGDKDKQAIVLSLTGDFNLDEISALTEKMRLPGGSELKKASKK